MVKVKFLLIQHRQDPIWNNTAPTSDVFYLNSSISGNNNGDNLIAYCFHSVSGYSKIGSYTGTGSAGTPSVSFRF